MTAGAGMALWAKCKHRAEPPSSADARLLRLVCQPHRCGNGLQTRLTHQRQARRAGQAC